MPSNDYRHVRSPKFVSTTIIGSSSTFTICRHDARSSEPTRATKNLGVNRDKRASDNDDEQQNDSSSSSFVVGVDRRRGSRRARARASTCRGSSPIDAWTKSSHTIVVVVVVLYTPRSECRMAEGVDWTCWRHQQLRIEAAQY